MAFLRGRGDEGFETTTTGMGSVAVPGAPGTAGTPAGGSLSAFIDQGSEFEGKLTFKDTVRIDGCFRGEIASENTLVVGETGEIFASVRSRNVLVSGSVTGDVVASERLVLHKTARVEGDVEAATIAIEEGAVINGRIKMNVPAGRSTARSLEALPGGRVE